MSQALQNTAISTRRAPRAVAAAIPTDVKPVPGVAAIITYSRLEKDFESAKIALLAALRPALDALFAFGAAKQTDLKDVVRTYMANDGSVTAQVQLKAKNIKKLSVPDAQTLSTVKIPLRTVPGRTVINPLYAGGGDGEGPQAVLVAEVIANLTKLIQANPNCGVPADFFVRLNSVNLPVEDALLRALQLPAAKRSAPLAVLADISVMRGEMESIDPLIDALNKQIAEIQTAAPAKPAG
jgi:hypothetical protein